MVSNAVCIPTGEHVGLGQKIATLLRSSGWPDPAIIGAISTLPIVELRGAIPVGHWMGVPPLVAWALAVAGNMIPVPLVLKGLDPLYKTLSKNDLGAKFFDWLFKRTRARTDEITKYGALGLMIFVAIPLRLTGAWSGESFHLDGCVL